jgi:hypothetical protein
MLLRLDDNPLQSGVMRIETWWDFFVVAHTGGVDKIHTVM